LTPRRRPHGTYMSFNLRPHFHSFINCFIRLPKSISASTIPPPPIPNMGSKKAAPDRVKAISHLEVALGFITGDRSLSRVSEDRRAPEVTKFLERIVVLCIEFFNNATPAGLREDKHLKVYVQEVLHEFGPILWPDCVPSWAFDPLDLKQSVLNKLAEEYPRQLRYSHLPDRAM